MKKFLYFAIAFLLIVVAVGFSVNLMKAVDSGNIDDVPSGDQTDDLPSDDIVDLDKITYYNVQLGGDISTSDSVKSITLNGKVISYKSVIQMRYDDVLKIYPVNTSKGFTVHRIGFNITSNYNEGYVLTVTNVTQDCVIDLIFTQCEHEFVEKIVLDSGCDGIGIKSFACKHCSYSYEEQFVGTGHNYENVIIESTCNVAGGKYVICSECGNSLLIQKYEKLNHDIVWTGCEGICNLCQKEFDVHDFENCNIISDPADAAYFKCTECGEIKKTTCEHDYVNYHEPTALGLEAWFKCSLCQRVNMVKCTGHNVVNGVCTICGNETGNNYMN